MARIEGGRNLARHLRMNARGKDITDTLLRAADRVRTDYIDRVNEGGAPGRLHVPSNPGEAPNADSGRLAGSATASRVGRNVTQTSVEAEYGAWLEFGTDKIAPRPALGPAFDDMKPHILRNIERALRNG